MLCVLPKETTSFNGKCDTDLRCSIIAANVFIDSSVDLCRTLDTSPRPQETGFTWVTYVDTAHIEILIWIRKYTGSVDKPKKNTKLIQNNCVS